ncbi:MAG: hypothetical protein JSS30_07370 [Verrucomicrobia bacterium]|nr:hypothetical protein [Verrucomicrobiota bacterium]
MLIHLPAGPMSSLDWDIDPSEKGTYYLDFEWKALNPFDTAAFQFHLLAVEQFSRRFPNAKKVILAKTSGEFSKLFSPSEKLQLRSEESGLANELFCAGVFSEYLHRLASGLPEETIPAILVDLNDPEKIAELMLLFCKRRFEHFQLVFSNIVLPIEGEAKVIVSLPQDRKYEASTFAPLFNQLKSYKCIPEELLNEHWDEVDAIVVDPESLGAAGKRMLYGFEAAGGLIVTTRGSLGFANETSVDHWISE